ncbi:MAG TPA: hypothetical protein VFE43_10500, partial [Candidatus Binataceae bacterium]|nr:hypothetical protein [Candidatus Binataceae bacterium]
MVRAAEGLHPRSDGADVARAVSDADADAAAAAAASNQAEAARRPDAQPPEAPSNASAAAHDIPPVPTSDISADPQGNLALPAERRRWNSLVSYPAEKAVGEAA